MARRDPLGFFLTCARRYGSVVSMRLGVHHVYLLHHPDHVKHVLQDRARAYAKRPSAARVWALFGDSLTVVGRSLAATTPSSAASLPPRPARSILRRYQTCDDRDARALAA